MSDKAVLSNLAVAVSGLFGMIQVNDQYLGALQSFAVLTTNSIVGTLQILGESLDKVFTYTSTAEKLLVYPFIVASLTDKYVENKNIAYSFIVIPIIPLVAFALGKDVRIEEFQQASTVLGSILMGYLSVRHGNPYIIATCLSHLCVMFALNADDKILNVSNRHWQNIITRCKANKDRISMSYSTILGISYAILAGSGLICYSRVNPGSYARFAYMGLISNGILGLFKWGGIEFSEFDKVYKIIEGIQDLFLLPCIASSLWVAYHYMREIGLFNILVSFSPLMTLLLENKPVNEEYKNAIIIVNLTTLAVLSLVHNNFSGIAVTAIYLFIHTDMVKNRRGLFGFDFQESYNCTLALFAIASVEMIMSAHY